MKTYVVVTGALFGLLTLAHIWRVIEEPHLAREPFFIAVTILSTALCAWSLSLARRAPQS